MSIPQEDRWLLPRRQTEYPARGLVAEARLHARREATFLTLATMFVAAIAVLVVSGTGRMIDVAKVLSAVVPGVELPATLYVPFGVIPSALGLFAVMLVCELYGRRRAAALLSAGLVVLIALVGLAELADVVDGAPASLSPAIALATAALVGHVVGLIVFDMLRRRLAGRHVALRAIIATVIAQLLAWLAAADVLASIPPAPAFDVITALALGAAAYTAACAIVLAIPLAIAVRSLALYLRVARYDVELAPVDLDEDDDAAEASSPLRLRAARAPIHPFSSSEMRFFTEGDQLGET